MFPEAELLHYLDVMDARMFDMKKVQTTTPYINTIDVADEPYFPGDEDTEHTYRRWLRWNEIGRAHV